MSKKKAALPDMSDQQREVFTQLSEEQRGRAARALEIRGRLTQDDVLGRYDLGAIVLQAKNAAPKTAANRSKSGEIPQLAKLLGMSLSVLYEYQQVAAVYERERVDSLVVAASKQGHDFTWSHFTRLATVRPAAVRRSLERQVVDGGISKRQLDDQISEGAGGGRAAGKVQAPVDPVSGLRRMLKTLRKLVKHHESWVEHVLNPLSGDISELTIAERENQDIAEVLELVSDLGAELASDRELLLRVQANIHARLGLSDDQESEDEEPVEEDVEEPAEEEEDESDDEADSEAYDDGREYDTVDPPPPAKPPRRRRRSMVG